MTNDLDVLAGKGFIIHVLGSFTKAFSRRRHECKQEGYELCHSGRILTVFSASQYCGTQNNLGCVIVMHGDLRPETFCFSSQAVQVHPTYSQTWRVKASELEGLLVQSINRVIRMEKNSLLWAFERVDAADLGRISVSLWAQTLETVLRMDLKFVSFAHQLIKPSAKIAGTIDYRR